MKRKVSLKLVGMPYEVAVALAYLLAALLWIFFSDRLLAAWVHDPEQFITLSLYKGFFYIGVTGMLLYVVLERIFRHIRLAQKDLSESEARYRLLVENQTDLVAKMDRTGRYLFVSPSCCTLFGKLEDALLGTPFMTLVHEGDQASIKAAWEILFKRPHKAYVEQRTVTREGLRWLAWQYTAMLDAEGSVESVVGVGRDITKKKQSEDALRESEAKLVEAQHIAKIGRWDLDFVSNTLEWSDEIYTLLEINREEYSPAYETMLSFIHPDDRERLNQTFQKARENKTIYELEHRLLMPDGRIKWVNELGRFEYDDLGAPFKGFGTAQDITDRKITEQALRESESNFEAITNQSAFGITVADLDGLYTFVNPAFCEMVGYSNEELLRMSVFDMKAKDQDHSSFEKSKTSEEGFPIEVVLARKDGTEFVAEVVGKIVSISGEQRVLEIVSDITRRQQAEDELEKQDELLRKSQGIAHVGSWELDTVNHVLSWSEETYQIFGVEPQEFTGSYEAFMEIVHPDDREKVNTAYSNSLEDGSDGYEIEHRIILPTTGEVRFVYEKCEHIRDESEQVIRSVGMVQDITGRKQAAEEKERLLAAINQASETVVITNAEGRIQYVNPAFEKVSGYSKEEVMGKNPRVLKSGEQDDVFYQTMWKILAAGETWSGRFANRKKDGTLYSEDVTISPVKDSTGKIINYVAIKTDITTELAWEKQYRQTQKLESVGRLAGGVAHDFNNILQTITGFCGLILADMDPQSEQRQDVIEIKKAAQLAGELTQQLLTFSRKQPTEYKEMDLNTVLSEGKKMLQQVLGENLQLQFELDSSLPPVRADASQILQVAMNLVVNARDAMLDGGTIALSTLKLEITKKDFSKLPNSKAGKFICFMVKDMGCGMDEKQLRSIYEPFFTTKKLGKGTGLGLSVVYGIVEEHGGWIDVKSEPEHGTSFKICLPVYEASVPGADDEVISYDSFMGRRILLVEDDAVVRELTAEILQDVGYAVSVAADASEAKKLFFEKNGNFDLLLSDVVLPGQDGIDLAEFLLKQSPTLAILISSGCPDGRIREGIISEKGFNYIQKPFNLHKLLSEVDRTITERLGARG